MTAKKHDIFESIKQKVDIYLNVGRFDAAEKLIKTAIQDSVTHVDQATGLHNLLGLTYHKQSKFSDALNEFKIALKLDQNYIEALLNITVTLCDLSRYDEAREVFAKAAKEESYVLKQPKFILKSLAAQHENLAESYQECGLGAEAIQEFRKALSLSEVSPHIRLKLAKIFIRSEQFERADKELDEAEKKHPKSAEVLLLRGIASFLLGQKAKARAYFQKARDLDATLPTLDIYLKLSEKWVDLK